MTLIQQFGCVLLGGLLLSHTSLAGGKHAATDAPQGFIGKPHAPVEIQYVVPDKIAVAEKLAIPVKLMTTRDVDALDVTVRFDEGLQGISNTRLHFGRSARNNSHPFEVTSTPQHQGLFYVHVLATLTIDGQQQSRSFVIPVNVGNVDVQKTLKSSGVVKPGSDGAAVISMPAQESRKPAK